MTYILRPQLETVRQERQNDEKAEERQKKYKDNKLGDKLLRAQQKNKSNPNMIQYKNPKSSSSKRGHYVTGERTACD